MNGERTSLDRGEIMAAWTPERLLARYSPRVGRHVRSVLRGDEEANDLVQNVLITILAEIRRLRDPACMDQWVAQITRAHLYRLFRLRRMRRYDPLESLPEQHSPLVQVNLDARARASRAIKLMERLPSTDAAILEAYWFSHLTHESLAARLGCSVITAKRRLARARTRFAKLARRDPELLSCVADSRAWSRRGVPAPPLV